MHDRIRRAAHGSSRAVSIFLLIICTNRAIAMPPDPATELVGLWKAKRWFGPEARGRLIIERTPENTYVADMMGRTLPVRFDRGELRFDLPNGQGTFRGKLQHGNALSGHWVPPGSLTTGFQYASPVHLEHDSSNRWSGNVVPFEDVFTFYLLVKKRDDGSLRVVLRNPERDWGGWLGTNRIVVEGDSVKLMGRRRGDKEDRVGARGRFDREGQVLTLHFPSRGGSYDFRRDDDQSEFYPRGKDPSRQVCRVPPETGDGWLTGSLEDAKIDRAAMEKLVQMLVETSMDSLNTPQLHGLLIARHGKLVLEEYFHGEHRNKLHETRSAAKSLTATLIGAALHARAPIALSTPVYAAMNGGTFPADLDPVKREMTLEHLLTMSSGFFCDDANPDAPGNEERMLDQTEEPDYYAFSLRVPMDRRPGEKAVYCSADPNLALGVLSRRIGESPLDTFDRLLGKPLGIERYGWFLDPSGQPYGGGSVQFLPRDFMKLGQLMLNGGTWRGHRILDRDFVERASSPRYHLRNIYYGYLWWGIDYPYKDRTVYAFSAGGAGGQCVSVIRELDLVVAVYAANYSSRGARFLQQELIPRYILPAVRERGDDPTAPVVPREFVTPYGPSTVNGPVVPGARRK